MELESASIESLAQTFSSLSIDDSSVVNLAKIVKIQAWIRGCIVRLKRLPLIMYKIKSYLEKQQFQCAVQNEDGRLNSCIDEDAIIKLLHTKFGAIIIKKPPIRMWYDILAYDYMYGWLPINIKTTTTLTSDNTGNLAMCVYAYTDEILDIHRDKSYENGSMSTLLITKLKKKQYNTISKKDYYFIVINKALTSDIIVNSVKGLSILVPNINNLPFQVCWAKNRDFVYKRIDERIWQFIDCMKRPKQSWKETFMANMRALE